MNPKSSLELYDYLFLTGNRVDGKSDVFAVLGQNFDHFSQRILSLGHAQTVS